MFFGTESAWIEGFSQSAAERYGPWSTCIIFLRNGIEAILAYGVDLVVGGGPYSFFSLSWFPQERSQAPPSQPWRRTRAYRNLKDWTHPQYEGQETGMQWGRRGGGHAFWCNLQNHWLGCHLKVVEFTGCLLMPHKQNGTTWHLIDRC